MKGSSNLRESVRGRAYLAGIALFLVTAFSTSLAFAQVSTAVVQGEIVELTSSGAFRELRRAPRALHARTPTSFEQLLRLLHIVGDDGQLDEIV